MTAEAEQPVEIKGGVIIQGSLFWEDENNCLQDDESSAKAQREGKERRVWRETHLNIDDAFLIPFPIRYGRCSSSRLCTYTMVISREYITPDKLGKARVVPFRSAFDVSVLDKIKTQIKELAKVEGIYDDNKQKYAKKWGAIAIWINPESDSKAEITTFWNSLIQSKSYEGDRSFNWSDNALINSEYKLEESLVESKSLNEKKIDFLLLTYMKPKHRNCQSNKQKNYPTSQEIADEIKTSGYSTYFCQNRASGITTFDDEKILKYIKCPV